MIALLDTEWRRFWARRAIRYLLAAALLLAVVVNVVQLARSSSNATTYQRMLVPAPLDATCVLGHHDGIPVVSARCVFGHLDKLRAREGPSPLDIRAVEPVFFQERHDRRIHVSATLSDTIHGMGVPLVLLSLLLSATFLGADFGTSLPGQLVFEPRRVRVYLAKVLAAAAGVAVVAALVIVFNAALQFVGSAWRGVSGGTSARWFTHRAGELGLVAVACAGAAAVAFAITAVARRTVAAVGVLFGMMIGNGFLASTSWGEPVARVLPMNALLATAQSTFRSDVAEDWAGLHTRAGALVLIVAWAASLSLVAAVVFRVREIRS